MSSTPRRKIYSVEEYLKFKIADLYQGVEFAEVGIN